MQPDTEFQSKSTENLPLMKSALFWDPLTFPRAVKKMKKKSPERPDNLSEVQTPPWSKQTLKGSSSHPNVMESDLRRAAAAK